MKIKLERIEEIKAALDEMGKIDIISDTSCRLSAFMDRIDAAYKPYNKTVGKLRDKYGKWKYRHFKETVEDNKPKHEFEILTLEGSEKEKYWANSKGEKVEVGGIDPNRTFWEANSAEDGKSFAKEMEKLNNMEFEIKLKPILLSKLVFLSGGVETKLNLKAGNLTALKDIIVNDIDKEEEPEIEDYNKLFVDYMEKLGDALDVMAGIDKDEEAEWDNKNDAPVKEEPVKEEAAA